MRVWFFVVLVAALLAAGSAQDPCRFDSVFTNYASFTTVSNAKACFASVASNADWRYKTIDTMLYLASLYSFTHLARDAASSGSSYNMQVDLVAQLNAMNQSVFASEWDFQKTMARLWRDVHDAHTFYNAPAPYNKFILCQPFKLAAKEAQGSLSIYVESIYLSFYTDVVGVSVNEHVGKTISTINGIGAVQWLVEFSDQFYISKDRGVRFNSGLQLEFMEINLGTIDLPSSDYLDIVFEGNPTSYRFPWGVFITRSFTGTSDFVAGTPNSAYFVPPVRRSPDAPMEPVMAISEIPKPVAKFAELLPQFQKKSVSSDPALLAMHERPKPVTHDVKLLDSKTRSTRRAEIPEASRKTLASLLQAVTANIDNYPVDANGVRIINERTIFGLTVISTSSTGETVYMIENDTAIISLSTFAPTNSYGQLSIGPCKSTIQYAIADAVGTRNFSRLLLDLRGNGGGLVCLSYGLQRVLVKDWMDNKMHTYGVYDFRKNALYDEIINSPLAPVSAFIDPDTEQEHTTTAFYTNGHSYTRGGVTGSYTRKWYMNCDKQGISTYGDMWISNAGGHYFKKIAILTDGLCGSACSQAETNLHTRGRAVVITIGGVSGETLETSSFAGGAVYDWSTFVNNVKTYTSATNPPHPLPTTAFTRFNFYESYMPPKTATLPREFIKQRSDFHLARWDFANTEGIYADAIALDWGSADFSSSSSDHQASSHIDASAASEIAPQVVVFVLSLLLALF